ncbi:hypothetical protein R0131_11310 [Clostridium sp. AL.422]|uniref:hypothetical protein n=1 Tax=Clostridium TaxID=1485 RepID=UPI00293DF6B9|nr:MULTISPECIES: hypothetical protein [unclassified Clostridium]MDV4151430.1 hypothetical protein [Clostridium sp. AL.422]
MLLKSDKIMSGLITKILEESWKYGKYITLDTLRNIHNLLVKYDLKHNEIFSEVVVKIYVDIKNIRKESDRNIDYIEHSGFILDENIYAANGRFNYIYRAKGNRTIWFENGVIKEYSVYCTIDNNGFYFSLEELDCLNFSSSEAEQFLKKDYDSPIYKLKHIEYILKRLMNINKVYMKDYYIEYLMNPPDVAVLSEFSKKLRLEIWESIFSLGKRAINGNEDERNLFKYCIELMASIDIDVDSKSLIDFFADIIKYNGNKYNLNIEWIIETMETIGNKMDKNTDKLSRKMEELSKGDIIELKPGIGGISLNLNEVGRRVKKKIKK